MASFSMNPKPASRQPRRNTSFSIHFVIKGSQKRRELAYARAKNLQRDLGVIPVLKCIK